MNQIEEAVIPEALEQRWIEACRSRWPMETCGVVFGRADGHRLYADGFAVIRNAAADPAKSFAFDPEDWVRAWYEAERGSRRIVGVFHSHPDGTVRPSAEDTQHRPGWGGYWIIGLTEDGPARIAAYRAGLNGQWRRLRCRRPGDHTGDQ